MRRCTIGMVVAALLAWTGAAPAQDVDPPIKAKNSNEVLKKHGTDLKLTSSSAFDGWPVDKAFDGDPKTSWFSEQDDSAAKGKTPWVEIGFPADTEVKHVTIIGNREPEYPKGFTVLKGKLELLDDKGKVVYSKELETTDDKRDFDFEIPRAMKVRSVRFTSLADQGNDTDYGDIAIAEIMVE
jgi:F5/8 type C domain